MNILRFLTRPSALQTRSVSTSTRNKSTRWIGSHKEPLTEEQRLRRVQKHKPFVLGRDNVVRNFTPTQIPSEALEVTKENAPYLVKRTQNGMLPVYTEYKNARGRQLTIIRRIDGDQAALARDLAKIFPKEDIELRNTTQHIWIKGNVKRTIAYWLTAVGF